MIGYSYDILKRRYRLLTTLLVILVTVTILIAISYTYSIIETLNLYIGGKYIVVSQKESRFGFTGVLDISNLTRDGKVLDNISPEILTPGFINGSVVTIRGVYPTSFRNITPYKIIAGEDLGENDLDSILVGYELAKDMNIDVGDHLILSSIWSKSFLYVEVKGILEGEDPFSTEVIINIDLARELRGLRENQVNIIRVRNDPSTLNMIYRRLSPGKIIALNYSENTRYYMRKFGITPDIFLIGLIPVIVLSLVSIKYLLDGLEEEHREIYRILNTIGYSEKRIKYLIFSNLLPYITIGIIIGLLIGSAYIIYVHNFLRLRFLIYITLSINNPLLYLLVFTLVTCIVAGYIAIEKVIR